MDSSSLQKLHSAFTSLYLSSPVKHVQGGTEIKREASVHKKKNKKKKIMIVIIFSKIK